MGDDEPFCPTCAHRIRCLYDEDAIVPIRDIGELIARIRASCDDQWHRNSPQTLRKRTEDT